MHFGWADPYDSPKRGELGRIIYGSGGLRTRYPLISNTKLDSPYNNTIIHAQGHNYRYDAIQTDADKIVFIRD